MVIDRQQLLKEIGVTKKEKKLKVKDWLKISQKKNYLKILYTHLMFIYVGEVFAHFRNYQKLF